MAEQADDSLQRYDHARDKLAEVDRRIQAFDLVRQTTRGVKLSADDLGTAAGLLREQARLAVTFARTAEQLADSLDADSAHR